jgi:hypothetical protein
MKYRFTNRTGGVSTGAFASLNLALHVSDDATMVLENRARIALPESPIQYMSQVHGSRVGVIEAVSGEEPICDALVTGIRGISLAVQVADCIPLLLYSEESVAAVHVGRQGLMKNVAINALNIMRDMGSTEITAIIGPSICGSCYEVSQEIYEDVITIHPSAKSKTSKGTLSLDLLAALREVLQSQRVAIIDESRCTVENSDLYSYRRDGVTGRQAGIISL